MSSARTLLGFDYGKKRIGIAVGQELTATATPVETLNCSDDEPDWAGISRLIQTWRPQALVVGLPLNMDGTEHTITQAARDFGDQLQQRFQLPVYWIDERLSSIEAEQRIPPRAKQTTQWRRRHKGDVDKVAAQLILQTWLAHHNRDS